MVKEAESTTQRHGRQTAAHHNRHRDEVEATRQAKGWKGVFLIYGLMAVGLILILFFGWSDRGGTAGADLKPAVGAIPAKYDPGRAMDYLIKLCDIGPRPSGSQAMVRQQEMLKEFFVGRGAEVTMQTFEVRHPEDGSAVPMANLIASWHPNRPKRFLLCAHYDTRPFPDRDPLRPRGVFVGANDGASGTAALMELSHSLSDLPPDVGVDIVLFDGEEFVFQQGRDDYFLGSTFFANKYVASPPAVPYRGGILLDMIGDRELRIYYEKNSLRFAGKMNRSIWKTADRLGVKAFVNRSKYEIDDDHIPLNKVGRIPTIDIIDFDYPRSGFGAPNYWHTEKDVPENCSGESMAAVVWVVHQWLKEQ